MQFIKYLKCLTFLFYIPYLLFLITSLPYLLFNFLPLINECFLHIYQNLKYCVYFTH